MSALVTHWCLFPHLVGFLCVYLVWYHLYRFCWYVAKSTMVVWIMAVITHTSLSIMVGTLTLCLLSHEHWKYPLLNGRWLSRNNKSSSIGHKSCIRPFNHSASLKYSHVCQISNNTTPLHDFIVDLYTFKKPNSLWVLVSYRVIEGFGKDSFFRSLKL